MTVYLRVNQTDGQNSRLSTASVKFSGALKPRLPANRLQSDRDIRDTRITGTTKSRSTNSAVGVAYAMP